MDDEGQDQNSRVIDAIRCHDITVSLADMQAPDLDGIVLIGMAVRLALHFAECPRWITTY